MRGFVRNFAFEFGYQKSIALKGETVYKFKHNEDNGYLDYTSVVAGIMINMGNVTKNDIQEDRAYLLEVKGIEPIYVKKAGMVQAEIGLSLLLI